MSKAFSGIRFLNILSLAVFFLAIGYLMWSLLAHTPLTEEQKVYAGCWKSDDGTVVQIWENGTGYYEDSSMSMKGSATIANGSITISFSPFGKKFRVTDEPGTNNGEWTMGLNGKTYTRQPDYLPTRDHFGL